MHNVRALEAGELLCWITGWSSDPRGDSAGAGAAGDAARARCCTSRTPPADARAPLLLSNPRWARPFEIFSRALGMPSSSEADPSAAAGDRRAADVRLHVRRRRPGPGDRRRGLVVPQALPDRAPADGRRAVGGRVRACSSAACSACTALLPALWLHPLDAPLTVLLAPLVGGAVLLTLGLGLNALEAWWRGELRRWLLTDAALIVVYLGLLAAFFAPVGLLAGGRRRAVLLRRSRACIERRVAAGLRRDRRADREDAADPDQHAVVRPRRRVRARPRRPVVGDRRADGRGRQHRRQGAGAGARQRAS